MDVGVGMQKKDEDKHTREGAHDLFKVVISNVSSCGNSFSKS
jgi:hypothetical protein